MKKERNSSVEKLKIIAIILIIISHCIPYGMYSHYSSFINLSNCTDNPQYLVLSFLRYLGSFGNAIFLTCSCYYLTDLTKINIKKIIKIIINTTIISIGLLCFFRYCFNISGIFSKWEIVSMIFPIIFSTYWYITAYLLFYIMVPLINISINSMDHKMMKTYFFIFIGIIFINMFAYNGDLLFLNYFVGFLFVYFIITYIKKYVKIFENNFKLNITICITCMCLLILSILLINYLGLKYVFFSKQLLLLNRFYNPLILMFAISLLYLIKNNERHNKIVNYISSLSLLIYVFHAHPYIQGFVKGLFFDYYYNIGYKNLVILSLLLAAIFTVGALILSAIYSLIEQFTIKLIKKTNCNITSEK